jgi:hypothetical protein
MLEHRSAVYKRHDYQTLVRSRPTHAKRGTVLNAIMKHAWFSFGLVESSPSHHFLDSCAER